MTNHALEAFRLACGTTMTILVVDIALLVIISRLSAKNVAGERLQVIAWLCCLISTFSAVLMLLALVGILGSTPTGHLSPDDIYSVNVGVFGVFWAIAMLVSSYITGCILWKGLASFHS